jgi:twitching motility protein PilT
MNIGEIFEKALENNVSDVFIIAGRPVSFKKKGQIELYSEDMMMPDDTARLITEIYQLAGERDISTLYKSGDDDFAVSLKGIGRFRVNTFKQRGSLSAVIRVINSTIPDPDEFNIPPYLMTLAETQKGMVLITGPAGSGKSTTLACMVDHINKTQNKHIITLEDPLEFLHRHNKCIVSQREIKIDTSNYVAALRAALRQSPDVILLGEMRDYETMEVATTAAETGHLLLSTLHTLGAANTIDRIIDVFPANQQHQIAIQLSMTLNAVVSQQLVPSADGGIIPAFEIMTVNTAVRNLIREGKVH